MLFSILNTKKRSDVGFRKNALKILMPAVWPARVCVEHTMIKQVNVFPVLLASDSVQVASNIRNSSDLPMLLPAVLQDLLSPRHNNELLLFYFSGGGVRETLQ